jgi:hypothetical protein
VVLLPVRRLARVPAVHSPADAPPKPGSGAGWSGPGGGQCGAGPEGPGDPADLPAEGDRRAANRSGRRGRRVGWATVEGFPWLLRVFGP